MHPENIRCQTDGIHFTLEGQPIFIPLMGRHTAVNALAAIAVARHLGVSDTDIIAGLATATGPEMRLQLQTAGSISILNDAYNANPHSMQAALETLRDMETSGRKIAILGDMRELGHTAEPYHRQIGQFAASCGLHHLVCVGAHAKVIAGGAVEAGFPSADIDQFDTAAGCAAQIAGIVGEEDLVLLKASRGMKLETVAAAIQVTTAATGLRKHLAAQTRQLLPRGRSGQRPASEAGVATASE